MPKTARRASTGKEAGKGEFVTEFPFLSGAMPLRVPAHPPHRFLLLSDGKRPAIRDTFLVGAALPGEECG